MKRRSTMAHGCLSFVLLGAWLSVSPGAAAESFEPPQMTVPAGFSIEVAAAPPIVKHPMMAGFDDRGRLFVAEAAGENLRRPDLEKQLPNFIRMLEDRDGDGVFEKSTIFADQLTFPMGALWHQGGLFVASSGAIWRFEDSDDDGVADVRTRLVSDFGYTGNAADVHGCFLGPCGRIYWCEGRHGHEFHDQNGRVTSAGKAARIFSCNSDGSDVRVHCGGGMDNPVEIDFLPTGEMLGTVNIMFRQRGDCLVHWMHGGVYPRYDQPKVTAEFRRTGDLLAPVHNFGHVAVSGMTRYRGSELGAGSTGNLFVTEFNTHKIKRVRLRREGPTFAAEAEDFLTSTFADFHPTDVLEDADGSLLVIDTGGWFRIGCPTSQIAKPNVLGAIYRIRRQGAPRTADARRRDVDWSAQELDRLAGFIREGRPAVQDLALAEVVRRGDAAVPKLATWAGAKDSSEATREFRLAAVWGLARIGSESARSALREQLAANSADVRLAAATAAGVLRDRHAVAGLVRLLDDDAPAVRREAATALGRIGQADAVPHLLATLREQRQRVEEHALIFALMEIGAEEMTAEALADGNPRVSRAALIVLDQLESRLLTRETVARLLQTDNLELRNAALEVISQRPTWGDEIVEVAARMLQRPELSSADEAVLSGSLLAFEQTPAVQQLVAETLANADTPSARRLQLLEVISQSALPELPAAWLTPVRAAMRDSDPLLVEQAVKTSAAIGGAGAGGLLAAIANDGEREIDLRISALGALANQGEPVSMEQFGLLVDQLATDVPPLRRLAAARCLGTAQLTPAQAKQVARLMRHAGGLELPALLGAFDAPDMVHAAGDELATALLQSPGLSSLSANRIRDMFRSDSGEVAPAAQPLLAKLQTSTAEQGRHLAALQESLAGGDPQRGKLVFQGRQAACATCHRVAGEGGQVGPDLSKIGSRRNDRDLLEAIVYPNASLARGFEGHTLVTTAGKVVAGLITRETAQAVFVRTADQAEIRVPHAEIEEMRPSGVSIMPGGLERAMSGGQLRDLVAYLRTLK